MLFFNSIIILNPNKKNTRGFSQSLPINIAPLGRIYNIYIERTGNVIKIIYVWEFVNNGPVDFIKDIL